jgi:hypothetical protein
MTAIYLRLSAGLLTVPTAAIAESPATAVTAAPRSLQIVGMGSNSSFGADWKSPGRANRHARQPRVSSRVTVAATAAASNGRSRNTRIHRHSLLTLRISSSPIVGTSRFSNVI